MAAPVTPNLTRNQEALLVQKLAGAAFNVDQVTALLRSFDQMAVNGVANATATQRGVVLRAANQPALTDSSTGASGGNTIAAVAAATAAATDTTAASLTSTNASITALKNAVATLAAKQNAIIAALQAAGIML